MNHCYIIDYEGGGVSGTAFVIGPSIAKAILYLKSNGIYNGYSNIYNISACQEITDTEAPTSIVTEVYKDPGKIYKQIEPKQTSTKEVVVVEKEVIKYKDPPSLPENPDKEITLDSLPRNYSIRVNRIGVICRDSPDPGYLVYVARYHDANSPYKELNDKYLGEIVVYDSSKGYIGLGVPSKRVSYIESAKRGRRITFSDGGYTKTSAYETLSSDNLFENNSRFRLGLFYKVRRGGTKHKRSFRLQMSYRADYPQKLLYDDIKKYITRDHERFKYAQYFGNTMVNVAIFRIGLYNKLRRGYGYSHYPTIRKLLGNFKVTWCVNAEDKPEGITIKEL